MVQHHSIQAKCTVTLDKLWQPAQGMPSEQIHHKKSSYLHLLRSSLLKLWTLGIPSDAKSMIHSIAAWRVHNFKGELAQGTKTKTQQMLQHLYTCNIYVHVSIYCIDIIESKWYFKKTSILWIQDSDKTAISHGVIPSLQRACTWRFLWIGEAKYLAPRCWNSAVHVPMFRCCNLFQIENKKLTPTGWWFQPIWKIWVKLEIFPK